jgi:hypothetical protein
VCSNRDAADGGRSIQGSRPLRTLTHGKTITRNVTVFREASKWESAFTKWNALTDRFDVLKDVLGDSPGLRVRCAASIENFTGANVDKATGEGHGSRKGEHAGLPFGVGARRGTPNYCRQSQCGTNPSGRGHTSAREMLNAAGSEIYRSPETLVIAPNQIKWFDIQREQLVDRGDSATEVMNSNTGETKPAHTVGLRHEHTRPE